MFQKYFEKNLSVIPIHKGTKRPAINQWEKYSHELPTQEQIDRWSNLTGGIGLVCGPASNVIVLDIDVDDREIMDLCPTSPVVRKGKKGECRFFKYNPKIPSTSIKDVLDILSIGRQVLIPPSIHPDTNKPYTWSSPDTIDSFDTNDLPELNLSFIDAVKRIVEKKAKTSPTPAEGGRNNALKSIVTAMRSRGESEEEIVKEVLEFDKTKHANRLFKDPKEYRRTANEADARKNASLFVSNVTNSLLKNNIITGNEKKVEITIDVASMLAKKAAPTVKTTIEQWKPRPFPMPTGTLKDIVDLINKYAEYEMPNQALAGAIAIMSIFCCNRYRYKEVWPNVYILSLAPTGAGKSFSQRVINKILNQHVGNELRGFGGYKSSSAIIKNLCGKRERLDIIDEVSKVFGQIKEGGQYQAEMVETLSELWSASSGLYSADAYAVREDTSTCFNPCISFWGSATIIGMKQYLGRVMMDKGLMPRMMIITSEEYSDPKDDAFLDEKLMGKVVADLERIKSVEKRENPSPRVIPVLDRGQYPSYNPIDLQPIDQEAIAYNLQIRNEFHNIKKMESTSEPLKKIFTRGHEQVMKLSIIHAVSNKRNAITLEDLKWAKGVVDVSIYNSVELYEETNTDSDFEKIVVKILGYIKRSKEGGLTLSKISSMAKIENRRLKEALDHLLLTEQIEKETRNHATKKSVTYDFFTLANKGISSKNLDT